MGETRFYQHCRAFFPAQNPPCLLSGFFLLFFLSFRLWMAYPYIFPTFLFYYFFHYGLTSVNRISMGEASSMSNQAHRSIEGPTRLQGEQLYYYRLHHIELNSFFHFQMIRRKTSELNVSAERLVPRH